jgi:hypothetical protein
MHMEQRLTREWYIIILDEGWESIFEGIFHHNPPTQHSNFQCNGANLCHDAIFSHTCHSHKFQSPIPGFHCIDWKRAWINLFMVYSMMLSITHNMQHGKAGWLVHNEMERMRWKLSWPNLRYCLRIFLKELGKLWETSVMIINVLLEIQTGISLLWIRSITNWFNKEPQEALHRITGNPPKFILGTAN